MTIPVLSRILIVEDDALLQAVERLALERLGGFTVEVCGSGSQAVEKAPGFRPDMIILDVIMPGMDGPTTFRALRAIPALAAAPICFMTAKTKPRDMEQLHELGPLAVLPKPFEPTTLVATLTDLWRAFHERPDHPKMVG